MFCKILILILILLFGAALVFLDGKNRKFFPPPGFSIKDMPKMTGKVVLITGANVGLGKESAVQCAKAGAKVILGCRSSCAEVVKQIKSEGGDAIEIYLDLSDLHSVYKFSQEFRSLQLPLHVLMLNAGVMAIPNFTPTKNGFESQVGVNWLAHFYLQTLLQDIVEKSAPSRVVIVTSEGHVLSPAGRFDSGVMTMFDKPENRASYSPLTAYGDSKMLNILHAKELDARMRRDNKKVYVTAVHPGAVATELGRYLEELASPYLGPGVFTKYFNPVFQMLALGVHEGALTQIWAAVSPDIVQKDLSGSYLTPIAQVKKPRPDAESREIREKVWAFGEKILSEYPK